MHTLLTRCTKRLALLLIATSTSACFSAEATGIIAIDPQPTTVKLDFFERPLPNIPLPIDLATRPDLSSPTGRRINASMIAPTGMESLVRKKLAQVDGWGIFQQITIPFTGRLDVGSILKGHRDADYATENDVIYLINIDRRSKHFGKLHHLDVGQGSYPVVVEKRELYWKNDPRNWLLSLLYEEADEDSNNNGKLDPGEDTDGDGELDQPNYLPGKHPKRDDLAGRADALMTFYERQTNTLIVRPMVPLEERTRYAVVVTNRIKDAKGRPVGSPYAYVNHASQTEDLLPLLEVLPKGLSESEIAFAFSFTTQTVKSEWVAVRDGLYGLGVQAQLGINYPAEISGLETLLAKSTKEKNLYIAKGDRFNAIFKTVASQFLGAKAGSQVADTLLAHQQYVDYYVVGSYKSPQLFPRNDDSGKLLPLDAQSWPEDLTRLVANAREETVYFWLAIPKKEFSARGQGKPAPLVIMGHGYTGNRTTVLQVAGLLAKHGLATIGIDDPSHGLGLSTVEKGLIKLLLSKEGMAPFADAILKDRAFDQNGDKKNDSGADFWTSYLFHTRDMVRQSVLDHMQLIRIVSAFDGKKKWSVDVDGGGKKIAGDFDGDGKIDIGGGASITMAGGSLGGMLSAMVGSLEPKLDAVVPIASGGGLADIGVRSKQSGVPEAFFLRLMGPLFVGTRDKTSGDTLIETILPDLNDTGSAKLATVKGVEIGDAVIVDNLRTKERGCGLVSAEGTFRTAIACNQGDRLRLTIYQGDPRQPRSAVYNGRECEIPEGAKVRVKVDTFQKAGSFQTFKWKASDPLVAVGEGLGLRRSNYRLRRFASISAAAIDRGDPASYSRHLSLDPLKYGTGESTGTHAFFISTVGDMSVPLASGMSLTRAAGLVDYLKNDPRYGKPVNQQLIDTYTAEGIDIYRRYLDPTNGDGVHLDVENLSGGKDIWGKRVPRMEKPLRIGAKNKDRLGGYSPALFPLSDLKGQHGFDTPGKWVDRARASCRKSCTQAGGEDPCKCKETIGLNNTYDVGMHLSNAFAHFLATGGTEFTLDLCLSRDDCAFIAKLPPKK